MEHILSDKLAGRLPPQEQRGLTWLCDSCLILSERAVPDRGVEKSTESMALDSKLASF